MNNQVIHWHCQHAPCTWFKALLYFPHFRSKLYRSRDECTYLELVKRIRWKQHATQVTKSSRKSGRRVHPASPHRHRKHRQIEGQCLQSTTRNLLSESAIPVSGQNKIGRELTLLAFIQPTGNKQNAVNKNWLLKLQPAVMLQNWQKSNFHQLEWNMQIHILGEILRSLICHNIYFYIKMNYSINV